MLLSKLIKSIKVNSVINFVDHDVLELALSSREVYKSCLFFAVKGNNFDGNDFIDEAISRGALAVITNKPSNKPITQIIVDDVESACSHIAYEFYKPYKKRVKVIGVVGTNGKTTTTFMIKSILESAGIKTGVIGTLGAYYSKCEVAPELTTPNPLVLCELLMNMANDGVEYAVIELSAHAIAQKRADAIYFESLVFTNCTHDHLDYFDDFSSYEETKKSVFNKENCRFAVINVDDKTGRKIASDSTAKIFTYGLENPCDVFAVNVGNSVQGVSFVMNLFDEIETIKYSGAGRFNVYNALASATVTAILGVPIMAIKSGISNLKTVKGRMEYVEEYNGAQIFIDYAHTPDGLKNTLISLKELTDNRLIVVFGCGGNRDKQKRSVMGEIAGEYADFTVITSDNPRYEEPYQIISQIESGVRSKTYSYITIQNRKMAIGYAVKMLGRGDVLVVAGKGAEEYQEIMGVRHKFNDKEEIRDTIAKLDLCGEII